MFLKNWWIGLILLWASAVHADTYVSNIPALATITPYPGYEAIFATATPGHSRAVWNDSSKIWDFYSQNAGTPSATPTYTNTPTATLTSTPTSTPTNTPTINSTVQVEPVTALGTSSQAIHTWISVSVKEYPYLATGNGSTDDTTAIQDAINYVEGQGGGEVIFPAGTYETSLPLIINNQNIHLIGHGSQISIIEKTTNSTPNPSISSMSAVGRSGITDNYTVDAILIIQQVSTTWNTDCHISGIQFEGASTPNTYGIYMPRTQRQEWNDVIIDNVVNGVYTFDSFVTSFTKVETTYCTNGFVWANDTSNLTTGTMLNLSDCYAGNITGTAYSIYGLQYSCFSNCGAGSVNSGTSTAPYVLNLNECKGLVINSFGAEVIQGCVAYVYQCPSVTFNALNGYSLTGNTFGSATATLWFDEDSTISMNNCVFNATTSVGNIYNWNVRRGSVLITQNCTMPSGGTYYSGWESGAYRIDLSPNSGPQLYNNFTAAISPTSTFNTSMVISETTNPTISNDNTEGFSVGWQWINTTTGNVYTAVSVATGAALWVRNSNTYTTASGLATLSSGIANVSSTNVTSTCFICLYPQDINTLGTCRVNNKVIGTSFQINSTGATDSGVIAWEIKETLP